MEKVVVLDFGGQYTHLLARRVRELGVYSEIIQPDSGKEAFREVKGIILSGGPQSVYDKDAIPYNSEIFKLGIPILGLCYGQQLIGKEFGGKVEPGKVKEYGKAKLKAGSSKLFEGLPKEFIVWMSHGDKVDVLPKGFEGTGSTSDCEFAAIADEKRGIYGLQFHPEVTHTENGLKIISNFIFGVCECEKNWNMEKFLEQKISEIQENAKDKNVFLLLSGGVDSTVCLSLLDRALGSERIHALHVDTGFMRKDESATIKKELEKLNIKEVNVVKAEERFLKELTGVYEPEEKRGIIGQLFADIAVEELEKLGVNADTWLLGQGTIYPDTIETGGTKHSKKIKTHHNRAPVIMKMIEKGKVIEPLSTLYKDEVRELGKVLGLPESLVERHPFPGPGLAIRILCSEGKEKQDKKLEAKVNNVSLGHGYSAKVLPVKAVGVQGDNRTYSNAVMLEGQIDYNALETVSTEITNKFSAINRVVYLVEPEKSEKVEAEKAFLTNERVKKLQEADFIAMEAIKARGLEKEIWQFPVVLLPVNFDGKGEGIVLRPVYSKEAMTAQFAKLSESVLNEISGKILRIKGIGAVMIDITHKPPATIEWE